MAVWVAKLALLVLLASADHIIVGVPPVITSQQEDVVVSSDVLANGSEANLVLSCEAAGDPTPSIAWFMEGNPVPAEFVLSDGRLVRNVTDGFGASQAGTTYYCTATNSIGPGNSLPATVRSRDIIVTYTFFNGFRNNTIRTVQLQTAVGGAVAMECDFLEASPRPRIQWFMNNGTFPIAEEMDQDEVLFVEEGRFLFIRVLTAHQRNSSFHCEVVNAFLGTQPQRSPITYTLGGDIPPNDLEIYIGDRSVTAIIGEPVRVVYAAARSSPGTNHVTCSYPGVEIVVTSGVVVTFTVSDELRQPLNLNCSVLVDVVFTTVMYTFKIAQPVYISAPAMGAASLTDRERLVGGGPVMFQCENQGIPAPMVTWYHNGETIQPDSGVRVNSNQVVISEPQVSNSGVYQCVVSNTIDGVVREDRRQWVLEVREPMSPVVTDLTATNPMAASDRIEGTVIVVDSGTPNVTVVVEVASDPCPEVQWSINGTNINDSAIYFFNNPCGVNSSLYNFTITIANLTLATSGQYSAVFSHLAGSTTLPGLYVTVPVDVQVLGLTLMVEGDNEVLQCLSKGQNVTLTCDIYGFPRLGIVFTRENVTIIPGGENFKRITKISPDQIQIAEVIRTDARGYSCEIGNAMPANLNLTFCLEDAYGGPPISVVAVLVVLAVLVLVVLAVLVVLFIRCRRNKQEERGSSDVASTPDHDTIIMETVFSQPTSIVWKKEPHGEHQIGAFGKRDVLIIRISDKLKSSLVGPAIPRRKGTLTSGDKRMLNTQGIPKECWGDDVQLMEARYRKDAERFDTIITWENASRESTMKKIRDVMNETEKPGVVIHYIGPGKKKTGHWCFADGYITFRDIKKAYNECLRLKSKCLEITCDCSYSGKWVSDCRSFLNATTVMACGHSAAEKRVFIKVKTSSRSDQIPHTLLYSARGWQNTSTGDLFQEYEYKVGQHQNLRYLDNTVVRCKRDLSIEHPCEKNYDWHKQKYLLKNKIEGKRAWQMFLVEDQDKLQGARILKTGFGKPPENIKKEIKDWNERRTGQM